MVSGFGVISVYILITGLPVCIMVLCFVSPSKGASSKGASSKERSSKGERTKLRTTGAFYCLIELKTVFGAIIFQNRKP
jgi:hypothetical protein